MTTRDTRLVIRRSWAVLLFVAWTIAEGGSASGQSVPDPTQGPGLPAQGEAGPRREARILSSELMSPFCPGLTLAMCPSGAALELRAEIASRFVHGETREAIIADLIARFGAAVSPEPPFAGIGALAWITPGFLGAGLVGLIAVSVRRGRRHAQRPAASTEGLDDPGLMQRVDAELDDLD